MSLSWATRTRARAPLAVDNIHQEGKESNLTHSGANKVDSTEVCSETAPEVVQQTIRQKEHVETAEAIDREKHIHHHQVSRSLLYVIAIIADKVAPNPAHCRQGGPPYRAQAVDRPRRCP